MGEVMLVGLNIVLGLRWIGFWIDGKDFIGFYGILIVGLIGFAVFYGCVWMYNEDVIKLF